MKPCINRVVCLLALVVGVVVTAGCSPTGPTAEEKAQADQIAERVREENERARREKVKQEMETKEKERQLAESQAKALAAEAEVNAKKEAGVALLEESKKRAIVYEAAAKLPNPVAGLLPPRPTRLTGKAIIWDRTTNEISPAHAKLPKDLAGNWLDSDLTVFLVTEKRKRLFARFEQVDQFGQRVVDKKLENVPDSFKPTSGIDGYRIEVVVKVLPADPTKPALGTYRVSGVLPPMRLEISRGEREVVGDYASPLAWFVKERYAPEPPPLDRFLAATTAAEAKKATIDPFSIRGDTAVVPYLAAKLGDCDENLGYFVICQMREVSGELDVSESVIYPMGPTSQQEYDADPAGWKQKWLNWASKQD